MKVAIIDYGSGNLRSAAKAFERAGAEITVTDDPDRVTRSDRLVLPGVGAFADCRRGLDRLGCMVEAIQEAVIGKGRPFLGICVGMQLMAEAGLEHGRSEGFGWIAGEVRAIEPADPSLKVPHMGWNDLVIHSPHPVFDGIVTGDHAYFVHSYHLVATNPVHVLATADHGGPITAAVARDNVVGTQFHPEKSQRAGLTVIANFLAWNP